MENYNEMFNPDLSEYNPVVSEIENLQKKLNRKKTNKGFFSSIIEKLMRPFVIVIQ